MSTVFETFAAAARTHAQRPWLSVPSETAAAYDIAAGDITYADAMQRVLVLRAQYAAAGYGPGHRVGLLLENRPAFFFHWFALNALGVSIVPLNPDLRIIELSYVIAHSEMVAIVAIPSRHAALREAGNVPVTAPDQPPPPVTPGGQPSTRQPCSIPRAPPAARKAVSCLTPISPPPETGMPG